MKNTETTPDWEHWREVRREIGRESYRKMREKNGLPPPGTKRKKRDMPSAEEGLDVPMIHPSCIPFGMYQQYSKDGWEVIHPHGSKRGLTPEQALQKRIKQELSRSMAEDTFGTDAILP